MYCVIKFLIHSVFVLSLNFLCSHNFCFFFNYCNNKNIRKTRQEVIHSYLLTLSWWRGLSLETSPLIRSANQWTGFYMLVTSVMKELNNQGKHILQPSKPLYMTVPQRYKMNFLLCKRSWHLDTFICKHILYRYNQISFRNSFITALYVTLLIFLYFALVRTCQY